MSLGESESRGLAIDKAFMLVLGVTLDMGD